MNFPGGYDGLAYSIVDMTQNGGLGAVVTKNVPLVTPTCEKVCATIAEGDNYWVVTHQWGTNAFYAYLLTNVGIMDTVISNLGMIVSGVSGRSAGEMKLSVQSFDFNYSTGVVSNPITLAISITDDYYGISFSPDGSKLYMSLWGSQIYQYHLLASDIPGSQTLIATTSGVASLQLAPDKKIYVATENNGYLGVINYPDSLGVNCIYADSGFFLAGKLSRYGLPNLPSAFAPDNIGIADDNLVAKDFKCMVYPNPFSNSTTIEIQDTQPTTYDFTLYDLLGREVFKSKIINQKLQIRKDNLPEGMYFYKVTGNNKILATGKIIIQ